MAWNGNKWSSAVVDYKGHDFRISFTIKNFLSYFCQPGEVLESPQMECTKNCGAKWTLRVYPYGRTKQEQNEIEVLLKLTSKPPHVKIARETYSIYIAGNDEQKLNMKSHLNGVERISSEQRRADQIRAKFGLTINLVNRSQIERDKDLYLPNGHLTIRCEGAEQLDKPNQQLKITPTTPSNALRKMYQEGICSDVILKTGSSEFQCHKCVLATASNYFKAKFEGGKNRNLLASTSNYFKVMFRRNTKENVIDLSRDLDEEELRAMLNYIYFGTLELSNLSSVQHLHLYSRLYEVDELEQECEKLINGQSNSGNAFALQC